MKQFVPLLFAGVLLMGSCKNDLDINAPWKDVTVIFGLLSVNDSVQYVKIAKAYLGEGDALEFASQYDSLYYDTSAVEVWIDEYMDDTKVRTFNLHPDLSIPKDPGIFSHPAQALYRFSTAGAGKLNSGAEYRLTVQNRNTGNEVTGTTVLLANPQITVPSQGQPSIDFFPQHPRRTTMRWRSVPNAVLYEVFIRFLYREYKESNPADIVSKYVEVSLGRITYDYTGTPVPLDRSIDNSDLYRAIGLNVPPVNPSDSVVRLADSLQFILNVADQDLYTYLLINQPSNTVAQERPVFSNITGGKGLFASRLSYSRTVFLSNTSVDSLRSNIATKELNFKKRPF